MSVELDNELLNVFLIEARELLESLGEQLVDLESSPGDVELLNAVFRAFHTVKGGAGFLGLNPMVELCHRAEDLLNEARNGAIVLDAGFMDALLESLDLLNDMMRAADGAVPIEPAPRSLLDRLLIPGRAASAAPVALAVPVTAPAQPSAAPHDPIEDEFEAMLDAARSDRAPAPASSGTISDDEFEALLDSLYGTGAPGTEAADIAPAVVVSAPPPPADPNAISDDEFEALLDSLHGTAAPGAVAPASIAAAVPAAGAPAGGDLAATPVVPVPHAEAASAPKPAKPTEKRATAAADTTVRVDTHRLDGLVDAAGELVLVRNRLANLAPRGTNDPMERAIGELERVAEDLQNAVLRMRMQPVGKLFSRFPRIVRDLARQLGKEIELVTEGEDTDIDRTVVEALADPLVHLLRNAVDHGIEMPEARERAGKSRNGTVRLAAGQFGDRIVITVTDDGKGMDPEVLRRKAVEKGLLDEEQAARLDERECYEIVFRPGFSTASQVSDISGRGVGMDVVKTKIVELGGTLSIDSRVGHGSTVRLSVPLTLAILRVLMVRVGSRLLSLPMSNVAEVFELVPGQIQELDGRTVAAHRQRALPLADLGRWAGGAGRGGHVVVVQIGHQTLGCLVDEVIGREDVMAKPLGPFLKDVPGIAGATITGDGRIALVLDLAGLADDGGQVLPTLRMAV
ncbi:two-component system, chemotaxis family, sensor kinase CheA [Luteibacter sp. UNCMF331Sha3.1]|uniref:chemotaxis protein CheA n=1 Tax=Luteibacter sp. UNCMF331Sha3.1 TaxID=1502760 RepID=UPI0008AE6983|nr:chemotaxis protein CheA [Luteibacter sp. UNCMF331Sha3.1]SEM27148.1 two-component system, chemotaxis family, sensor kinase CheA [Luteibacter sp. UNCMF331Sha3.1]